jgi:hypothetical protein
LEKPIVTDFMGREIAVGSTICYPVRRASSMWMVEMRVQQINLRGKDTSIAGYNTEGRRITIRNIQNVVVVEPRQAPALAAVA